jgi:hypothetical protein
MLLCLEMPRVVCGLTYFLPQNAFKEGVALAAAVPVSSVIITSVRAADPPAAARRVLTALAEVEFVVNAKDSEQMLAALQSLEDIESVSKSLSKKGIQGARVGKRSPTTIVSSEQAPISLYIGVSAGSFFVSMLCCATIAGWWMRHRNPQIVSMPAPFCLFSISHMNSKFSESRDEGRKVMSS